MDGMPPAAISELLARGEYAAARDACERLLARPGHAEDAAVLDALATAEFGAGAIRAAADAWERAYRAHVAAGDGDQAALVACRLADVELSHTGAEAVARGWLDLARHHQAVRGSPEVGVQVEMLAAYHALAYDKDMAAALAHADRAAEHAAAAGDDASRLLALSTRGLALASTGDVTAGFRALDEAAAAAVAGHVPTSVALDVYCILITAYERVRAFDRIAQWARRVLAGAEEAGDGGFADFARSQYANVLVWTGHWEEAERLLDVVLEDPEAKPLSAAMGLVYRSSLRRRQGRLEEADDDLRTAEREPFRRAVRHMVLQARAEQELAAGDHRAAVDVAARFLRIVPEGNRVERVPALTTTVRGALLLGDRDAAARAIEELEATAGALGTDAVAAASLVARGLLAEHDGQPAAAVVLLEEAVDRLDAAGLPHDMAAAQLDLARTLLATGDADGARRVLADATRTAEDLGAARLLSDAADVASTLREAPAVGGLTPRELEVLRLLATGASNDEIAEGLVLSVRTVERHVSNIYLKLGVTGPSARTVAAAYAHEHAVV